MDILGPRLSRPAFQGGHEGGGLAADERPAPAVDADVEVKPRIENILAQEPVGPGLLQGNTQVFDRQRVFVPHIDVSLVGADGEGPDDHPFDDAVRVSFHDGPVHEGPGVSFVPVAYHVANIPVGVAAGSPFLSRGEPAAAAAPQARTSRRW